MRDNSSIPEGSDARLTGDAEKAKIAVLIPCLNEEITIAKVVTDFRAALLGATVYVYDNDSTDGSAEAARRAGAVVRSEPLRGKGNVVRRMFADIDADIYVLVDGDDTYDAGSAPAMVTRLVERNLDIVNGRRTGNPEKAYRWGHRMGNAVLTTSVAKLFGNRFQDIESGYKIFSRRFVKSFPITISTGFQIEPEIAIHALELKMPTDEMPTPYRARPEGSLSKLRTFRDGIGTLWAIFLLLKEERPLAFFTTAFIVLAGMSFGFGTPVIITFVKTGLVPRFPTAILATGLMLLAFLSLACGLILDTVTRGRKETKRLQYLMLDPPQRRRR